jgi:hypothetical protein
MGFLDGLRNKRQAEAVSKTPPPSPSDKPTREQEAQMIHELYTEIEREEAKARLSLSEKKRPARLPARRGVSRGR